MQCHGQGELMCTQCHGQRRETCYQCGGRGENPQQPGQACQICNGQRTVSCRFCQGHGTLSCPTCQGKRGTTCTTCQGKGSITQEVTVTSGAETHFKLDVKDLPSGLRRGLDRIGIANLGKGHADITANPPPESEDGPPEKPPFPLFVYTVSLPYAEMRMGFGAKKAVVSVFGKRGIIFGVPNFLDASLQPARDTLRAAATGKGPLEAALATRAISEIFALVTAGKGRTDQVRKLYPFGLSAEAITVILADTHLALNQATLKIRTMIAVACVLLCAGLFDRLLMTGFFARATAPLGGIGSLIASLGLLAAAGGISWALLNFATRAILRKRFPALPLALRQKIGKTGLLMLGGIVVIFIALMLLAPVRVLGLAVLLR
jgi:hypothetical protein